METGNVMANEGLFLGQSVTTLYIIIAAFAVIIIILGALSVINLISVNRLNRKYEAFMGSDTSSGQTIEQLLYECLDASDSVLRRLGSLEKRIDSHERRLTGCIQKYGVVRYNPFDDTGGDLSFVVALLDDTNSGFVINGIYNRSGSYTYAKEVERGAPVRHKLSSEELEALNIAMRSGGSAVIG